MGTTIDDVLQQQAEEEDFRREEIESAIADRKGSPLVESSVDIHDYLPIARGIAENEYIVHLWDAFLTLDTLGESGRGFSMMPFHILFMLALQYKVLRISKAFSKECNLVFCTAGGRSRDQLVNPNKSVFDLALLYERTMPELFSLVGLDDEIIKKIKDFADYRNNNLAHPKGGIEADPDGKVEAYMEILRNIQPCMLKLNNGVAARWLNEMKSGEAGVEYIELHLAEEYLCPADMWQGELSKLDRRLNNEI
jgi:hypothetical protein